MITREDGVFLPIGDWAGHYHVETFAMLEGYLLENNYPQVWELIDQAVQFIREAYGNYPWLDD
ncbi:hypothetical protein ABD76_05655 [Paenibacillus dendritiformis]|uniref:hypothetical protein n=1 Tax=Paenibacillus dendritiformis TaxID=130049 RepID=UPI0018CF328A|nr:hypothetical protein [Paenibacillus dendritiformis]MBG9792013.1 hypothetical protein [Paenibacillus dendritiformis]